MPNSFAECTTAMEDSQYTDVAYAIPVAQCLRHGLTGYIEDKDYRHVSDI